MLAPMSALAYYQAKPPTKCMYSNNDIIIGGIFNTIGFWTIRIDVDLVSLKTSRVAHPVAGILGKTLQYPNYMY